ncbi:hypothetical protein SAMN05421810_110202 [Amycolatopsis arida]|uniref:Peptidase_C39 like family protein n=1 Tax=Amycolatopsis arida TaxID=587909 RepID=A0A1I5ZX53_9PSEU|nr:hypothetical protein [Amycolatopsis arida]TDX89435.1 hypothetical protein CLV69_110203 [Amycolatopsis arida]SFQ61046.1 hypothetical protein SAMN05421810_110202 [Amycolatopsis arida]
MGGTRVAWWEEARWLPGGRAVVDLARAELPQKDDLCGAFTVLVALRAHGVEVPDQDTVAEAAGTVRLAGGRASRPPGEPERLDFRLPPPSTTDPARAGTSAAGLARAVRRLSADRLRAVPARGDWTATALRRLLTGVERLPVVALVANVATGELAAPDTPWRAVADYLATGMPPLWLSRWRVGHFVLVAGRLDGPEGSAAVVVDGYPSLGERGVYLQPLPHLAAALRREGRAPGGVLLVVRAADAAAARDVVLAAGLTPRLWDNGSPAPD